MEERIRPNADLVFSVSSSSLETNVLHSFLSFLISEFCEPSRLSNSVTAMNQGICSCEQ